MEELKRSLRLDLWEPAKHEHRGTMRAIWQGKVTRRLRERYPNEHRTAMRAVLHTRVAQAHVGISPSTACTTRSKTTAAYETKLSTVSKHATAGHTDERVSDVRACRAKRRSRLQNVPEVLPPTTYLAIALKTSTARRWKSTFRTEQIQPSTLRGCRRNPEATTQTLNCPALYTYSKNLSMWTHCLRN